jgi:hypothetical protein
MTRTIDKTPEQILTEAAELVEQAWVQERFHQVVDGKVCHCADGALMVAAGVETVLGVAEEPTLAGTTNYRPGDVMISFLADELPSHEYREASRPYRVAAVAANRAVEGYLGYQHPTIIGFNDELGRTKEQVAAALRRAVDFLPEAELAVAPPRALVGV